MAPFRLANLPMELMDKVINEMKTDELVHFSLTSTTMRNHLKSVQVKKFELRNLSKSYCFIKFQVNKDPTAMNYRFYAQTEENDPAKSIPLRQMPKAILAFVTHLAETFDCTLTRVRLECQLMPTLKKFSNNEHILNCESCTIVLNSATARAIQDSWMMFHNMKKLKIITNSAVAVAYKSEEQTILRGDWVNYDVVETADPATLSLVNVTLG